MKRLVTIYDGREFFYEGSILTGIKGKCGPKKNRFDIKKETLSAMLKEFKGQTIKIGAHRTQPKDTTLGYWIKNNNNTNVASYLCPILVAEGYANVIDKYTIQFTEK